MPMLMQEEDKQASQLPAIPRLLKVGIAALDYLDNRRFEWQTLELFLHVASQVSPISQQELEKRMNIAQSAISRNVAKLGNGLTMNDPGARVVESYEDPTSRNRKLVRLTSRGEEFKNKLLSLMGLG